MGKKKGAGVIGQKTPFATVEAYKTARTNLMYTRRGEGCQRIVFTSSLEGEGKTLTCTNMAVTTAQNNKKVLIIDADLRRPRIGSMFQLSRGLKGLSELLAGLTKLEDMKDCIVKTKHSDLWVLPAGQLPPNPAELLASPHMERILDALSTEFDYIMIDTPPVSVVTDPAVLSEVVSGYIFVVRENYCPMEIIKESVERLQQVEANVLGFIYNDARTLNSAAKYGAYYKGGEYRTVCMEA